MHEIGRSEGDDPAVDERRLVEVVGSAGQIVGRRDDRPAGLRLRFEDAHQVLLGRHVHPRDRFVEQVQVRLRRERLGEEDPAALPARQGTDLAVSLVGHPDGLERRIDRLAILAAHRAAQPDQRHPAHHHDVADGDRERPVDELRLRDVGDPLRRFPRGPAEDLDGARDRREQPGDRLEERALARPVRADDRQERAGRDLEIDVGQRDAVAVARRDVAQPDRDRRRRSRSPERLHDLVHVPAHHREVGVVGRRSRPCRCRASSRPS